MNAMIVDSSALTEQVVVDVLASAFDSAGQRCSALRVSACRKRSPNTTCCAARGANVGWAIRTPDHRYRSGDRPRSQREYRTPYSGDARQRPPVFQAVRKIAKMPANGERHLCAADADRARQLDELKKEVFGPVLHVVRYNRNELDKLVEQINASGYGLTLACIPASTRPSPGHRQRAVGNLYVNRNMVGAVVGVQPFGGEGLSGTGKSRRPCLYIVCSPAARKRAVKPDAAASGCVPLDAQLNRCWKNRWRRCTVGEDKPGCRRCASSTASWRTGIQRVCCRGQPASATRRLMPRERVLCVADNQDALTSWRLCWRRL
jgi:RHH-type proline utilization regulon transcriptional repressor/proline dehydrogenase/delta 1-pyrroline-5-carboxylate dehydrogenase